MTASPAFGQQISQGTITQDLLTGPGQELVAKTLLQMSQVPGFVKLFGKYTPAAPFWSQMKRRSLPTTASTGRSASSRPSTSTRRRRKPSKAPRPT